MKTRERHPVDWDAEIRKTERIQRRGFIMSAVSFAAAAAFIFGMRQFGVTDIDIPRKVLSVACLAAAGFVFFMTMRRRARLKKAKQERERDAE